MAVLLLLPFVDTLAPELTMALGPFRSLQEAINLSDAIVATMILLPVAGLGMSFVQVGARTEVYQRVPGGVIAQVFATQSMIGSIAALVPTFFVGVMLDLLPVRVVLILLGSILTAVALSAWWRGRRASQPMAATA